MDKLDIDYGKVFNVMTKITELKMKIHEMWEPYYLYHGKFNLEQYKLDFIQLMDLDEIILVASYVIAIVVYFISYFIRRLYHKLRK